MAKNKKSDIKIKNLYKIFGPDGAKMVEKIKDGMSKSELNERYNHVLGLNNINISMLGGKIQVVMGLSGSGKSTLIRHINRLIDFTSGKVLYGHEDVCRMSQKDLRRFRRHKTAMVFQKFALLPHRTVMKNAVYGLEIQGVSEKIAKERAGSWLSRVGLEGFEDHYPNQLSGGMQQRVGLARALANDADILLMDEAFSALDPLIRMDMQKILLDLQQDLKKTVVFITHDLDEALRLGDRIAILRDGAIIQQGTGQDIVLNPADNYIANFVREVNRGRVILVDSIMDREIQNPKEEDLISLPSGTSLEEAAKKFTETGRTLAGIQGSDGKTLGTLTLQRMVSAMIAQ